MFYHHILFFSQIRIWTIAKQAHLLPLDRLHVLLRCANPSIWYGLTHELHSILLEHTSCGPACLRFASRIISAISKSIISKVRCVRDKTLKKDDQKSYLEVAPHCPLSGSICHIGSKNVVVPACGRRASAIAPSDLTRVVHTHEVT
jgi:hypothetical protein